MSLSGIRSTRIQRRPVFWLVALCALVCARGQPAGVAGTLPEDYLPPLKAILENAWKQSPQTIEKALELAQREAQRDILNSERLPRLHGSANYALNETAPSGANGVRTTDTGFFYSLELTQSIFRWGELQNKSALGRLGVLMAEKRYAEAYRALAQALRESYMRLVAQKLGLQAARYQHQLRTEDFNRSRAEHERGALPDREFNARELAFAEQGLQLAVAEEEFAAARRGIARLAGTEEIEEESIPDAFPAPSYSPALAKGILADVLREGGQFSFDAEMNALQAQEADLNYRIARVRLLPKLEAAAISSVQNLATAGPNAITQTGVATQTLAVRLDWWIFDGLAARGEKRQALLNREMFERRTQQATERALEQVQQLERRLALDARMLEIAGIRLREAEEEAQRQRDELAAGRAAESAVASARLNLLHHQAHNANLRTSFLARWSEFVSLAGLDPAMNNLPARYARE